MCFVFLPCCALVAPFLPEVARTMRHTNMLAHLIPWSFVGFSIIFNPWCDTRGPRRGAGGRHGKSQKNHVGLVNVPNIEYRQHCAHRKSTAPCMSIVNMHMIRHVDGHHLISSSLQRTYVFKNSNRHLVMSYRAVNNICFICPRHGHPFHCYRSQAQRA